MKSAYIQLLLLVLWLTFALSFNVYVIVRFGFSPVRIFNTFTVLLCMAATAAMYGYIRKRGKELTNKRQWENFDLETKTESGRKWKSLLTKG
ncbi:MAG: hypothetical protein IJV24_07070 [Prevotella sp.]|nr:hypothetical protein [Prevotella sp.]